MTTGKIIKKLWAREGKPGSLKGFARKVNQTGLDESFLIGKMGIPACIFAEAWLDSK